MGCNLTLHVQDNQMVKVTSPADHDITRGNLCIKGRSGSSTSTRSATRPTARERRRSGPLAAGVIATVLRDGERDEVPVEEPLEVRVDGEPLLSPCAHPATTRSWHWDSSTARA